MTERWVVNASPLIVLGKIGRIELICSLADEFFVPIGVAEELGDGPADDPARSWIEGEGAARVVVPENVAPIVAAWDLGKGESQVLSWALAKGHARAVLDDRAARKCAECLAVPVIGTLGVLLLAKRKALVAAVKPLLDDIVKVGFRITPEVMRAVLYLAKE